MHACQVTYVPTYTYIHKYDTYIHTCIHTYLLTYMPPCMHASGAVRHVDVHTYVRTYLHAYIHTYIHTEPHHPPPHQQNCQQMYIPTFLHPDLHMCLRTYIITSIHRCILCEGTPTYVLTANVRTGTGTYVHIVSPLGFLLPQAHEAGVTWARCTWKHQAMGNATEPSDLQTACPMNVFSIQATYNTRKPIETQAVLVRERSAANSCSRCA